MARIFISGVAGFLGSHLADRMLELGHEVVGCDNLLGGYLDNVNENVEFYQYDCNYYNSMVKITKNCDVIYHCAATAYEGLSVFSPFVVTKNIVTSSVSVFTAAAANGVKRVVNCSSMARYGANEVPFTEDMTPRPQDPYGVGKVAAEQFLKTICDEMITR
jgi:UDP-glucose 4-epimerase